MSEMEGIEKKHFNALTGLRGFLAVLIFLNHFNSFKAPVSNIVNEFYITLPAFFVLSGFLISYRYYSNEQLDFRKYIVNRVARIYPIYFLLTTLTFVVMALFSHKNSFSDLLIYILNVTFIRGFFDNLKFTGIAQGWSLTVEEIFYVLAPVIFLLIKRSKYFLIILPLFFITVGLGIVHLASKFHLSSFFSSDYFMIGYTFFGRSFEFFVGIVLSLIVQKYGDRINTRWCTGAGIAVIFVGLCALAVLKKLYNYDYGYRHPLGTIINNILVPLFGISIFYWGLIKEKTIVQKFLSTKFMMLIGKSSYVFYLIHMGVIQNFLSGIINNMFITFILLECIAVLIFKSIEEPLNLLVKKSFAGNREKFIISKELL